MPEPVSQSITKIFPPGITTELYLKENPSSVAPEAPNDAPATESEPLITPAGDPWPRPYYFEDGLRRVRPYFFTYNTHAKERWRNRELVDIFASEFRDRPIEYYEHAIEIGNIVVNGQKVPSPNTIVRNGDVVTHTIHRHEPPVTPDPIGIVYEDEDIIAINKPAGMPVHPAGRYNFNSVIEVLRAMRGYTFNPRPCNRLDRLTSGIMFIGKHPAAALRMSTQLKERTIRKEYVARVVGEFPEGEIICEKPILQISPKVGLNAVRANGKAAKTVFKRLAYYPPRTEANDGVQENSVQPESSQGTPWKRLSGYSIVRCLPLTGRTHQLRVHLQYLGHPISNDPIYSNQRAFGPALGKGLESGEQDDDIITRLSRMGKEEVADAIAYHDEMVDKYQAQRAEKMTGELCDICNTPLYSDPGLHELGIYLHAKRYECAEGNWAYETELPKWALPPEGYQGPTECTPETDPLAIDLAKLEIKNETNETVNSEDQQVKV